MSSHTIEFSVGIATIQTEGRMRISEEFGLIQSIAIACERKSIPRTDAFVSLLTEVIVDRHGYADEVFFQGDLLSTCLMNVEPRWIIDVTRKINDHINWSWAISQPTQYSDQLDRSRENCLARWSLRWRLRAYRNLGFRDDCRFRRCQRYQAERPSLF